MAKKEIAIAAKNAFFHLVLCFCEMKSLKYKVK